MQVSFRLSFIAYAFNVRRVAGCVNDPMTRMLSYMYIHARDVFLLVWPAVLKADYSMPTVPLVTETLSTEALIAVSAYALAAIIGVYALRLSVLHRDHRVLFALLWFAIPFLPGSNFIAPVGFVIAERTLYLPSAGFCLLAAILIGSLVKRAPASHSTAALTVALLLSSVYAARSYTRNEDWHNSTVLWRAELPNGQVIKPRHYLLHRLQFHHPYILFRCRSRSWSRMLSWSCLKREARREA